MTNKMGPAGRGTNAALGLAIVVFSAIGFAASVALINSEIALLQDPQAELACDLNPLIGCSSSLLSPQAHLLGLPNSVLGTAAFAALLAVGAVLMFGGKLPNALWWFVSAGSVVGLVFVGYFLYQSAFTFHALCPFCLVVWASALGLLPLLLGGAGSAGAFGRAAVSGGERTLRYSWAVILLLYLLVVLTVVVTMSDKIGYLFGG